MTPTELLRFVSIWLVCLAAAFCVDAILAEWLFRYGFFTHGTGMMRGTPISRVMKLPGDMWFIAPVVIVLVVLKAMNWRQAVALLACAGMSVLSELAQFIFGRARPLYRGDLMGAWDFVPFSIREGGNAFPSGHAMLAFATALCFARYYPRWALAAYACAVIVSVERVASGSHFLSDVVMSAGLAIMLSAWCLSFIEQRLVSLQARFARQERIAA